VPSLTGLHCGDGESLCTLKYLEPGLSSYSLSSFVNRFQWSPNTQSIGRLSMLTSSDRTTPTLHEVLPWLGAFQQQ
jgi:hypothetical protein